MSFGAFAIAYPAWSNFSVLTRLTLDKMAAILQMTFSDAFFMNEKFCILIKISLKFVPKGPIDNNPALV